MMRFLIDGYNLAHCLTLRAGQVSKSELAQARIDLVKYLAQRHGREANAVTVVFDASSARNIESKQTIENVDVRMAIGESADDVIERLVKDHSAPKQLTVVSDDRRVQAAGRHRGCRVLECQKYLDWLKGPAAGSPVSHGPEKPDAVSPTELAQWEQAFSEPLPRRRGR
jgi:predicted RNA-binding protein with PIN domain